MTIVWVTDVTCTGEVEWGPTGSYGYLEPSAPSVTRHEVAITGLSPNTLYHYRVRVEGTPLTQDATFTTAPDTQATAISFTIQGDSRSAPATCEAIFDAMLPETRNGFCVTLGDLPGRGEDHITDYWQSHFFTPARNYINKICLYPCIGNHELYDETATYVYPHTYLDIWSLPTDKSGTEFYYSFDKGPVHFVGLDVFWTSYAVGSDQYNWLNNDLLASTKPWKIVFMHTGPYVSQKGIADGRSAIRSALVPVFENRGVDLVLYGDYHDYQRNIVNGVTYLLQGCGGAPLNKTVDDSQSYVQAYASEFSFTRLDIQGNTALGWTTMSDGTVLDGFQITKSPADRPWRDVFPATGPQLHWTGTWRFASQCGVIPHAGNPSGDGCVFQVGDISGQQYAWPMPANESLNDSSIEADVRYDAGGSLQNRFGIGLRGRLFFSSTKASYYAMVFVRNDSLAANGHCVLFMRQNGIETVLADWAYPDVSGWHKMKLAAAGSDLAVWIDDVLKTQTPISNAALTKGRPFVYNYRAGGGAKTLVDDVVVGFPVAPALITDFEGYVDGAQALFRPPTYSGSTSAHLAVAPDTSQVVTASAFGGTKVCQADWAFLDADPQRWLRLTTSNAAYVPNPAVDLTRPIRFRCRLLTPGSVRVCLGIRETGVNVPIGADGGKIGTIEWLGATSVASGAPQGILISDQGGQWHTLTFDPLIDAVQAFTGDSVLIAPNHMGVLEHVAFASTGSAGPFSVQLDGFEQLPAGDLDGDGDTDLEDYAIFEECLTGPGGSVPYGCEWADLDGDVDIDSRDYGRFQSALPG